MLSTSLADKFRSIVGQEWFLESPEDLATYSYDAFLEEFDPDAVIVPGSTEEISKILHLANQAKINIIPRGAGTNLSGNSVARKGGLIMVFQRLNKILEIDTRNRVAVVQPGVVNADLQQEVGRYGLMYPPDPASMFVCTMGGNVALNAGGPRGVKYGVTRDYLLGLEVVLATGDVIRTGGKALKNVTGFDLTRLMCGSEGALGIITEITVRLIPTPPAKATLQAIYSDLEACARTVSAIIGSGIVPTTLELLDKFTVDAIRVAAGIDLPEEAEALLLIEVDGEDILVETQGQRVEEFCKEHGAIEVQRGQTPTDTERLWQARRASFGAVARLRPNCMVEDATVPVDRLPDMLRKIVELGKKYKLMIGVLAHAGDGNLHPAVMCDLKDKEEMARIDKALDEFFAAAIEMGGTLSGEHGIGIAKQKWIELEYNSKAIEIMRGIKKVFDPNNILNPGSFI
jgi:glycolate oxidase